MNRLPPSFGVIQMIGLPGCGKSVLSRALYLHLLDHPFEHQMQDVDKLTMEEDACCVEVFHPSFLLCSPNVPRWLTPKEHPSGYAAAVMNACGRKPTAAGEPPVTHLILDDTHVTPATRDARFYPTKEQAAIWLYVLFTHSEGSEALYRDVCVPCATLGLEPGVPSTENKTSSSSKGRKPPSASHGRYKSGKNARPFVDVAAYAATRDALSKDSSILWPFSPAHSDPPTHAEPSFSQGCPSSLPATVGAVEVDAHLSVTAACQRVLEAWDALIRTRRRTLQPQQRQPAVLQPLSFTNEEEKKRGNGTRDLVAPSTDASLSSTPPRHPQPYRKTTQLSVEDVRREMEESSCTAYYKRQGETSSDAVQEGRKKGGEREPPTVVPTSAARSSPRSPSSYRRELVSVAYDHYREHVLGISRNKFFLYAAVSILPDSKQPSFPHAPLSPSPVIAASLPLFGAASDPPRRAGNLRSHRPTSTAKHPFHSLLQWIPNSFLLGKKVQKEFHVTLNFLGNGVDPHYVVALGEEVLQHGRADAQEASAVEPSPPLGEHCQRKSGACCSTISSSSPFYAHCVYDVPVKAVVSDQYATAMVVDTTSSAWSRFPACANEHPHITIATTSAVTPAYSNILLRETLGRRSSTAVSVPSSADAARTSTEARPYTCKPGRQNKRFVFWCDRQVIEEVDQEDGEVQRKTKEAGLPHAAAAHIVKEMSPEGEEITALENEVGKKWRQTDGVEGRGNGEPFGCPVFRGVLAVHCR